MFDWRRGSKEQRKKKGETAFGDIISLSQHVRATLSTVEGIANDLSSEYTAAALLMISKRFEDISKEYADFTIVTSNYFYEIIHRSNLRSSSTKRIAKEAKSVAKVFEKYAKKPKSYSAVECRYAINALAGGLKNLVKYSTSDTPND